MGKQYRVKCPKCGQEYYFTANSKRLSIKCKSKYKRIISGRKLIGTCGQVIINKGFVSQPNEVKGRLKLKNMKYGKQTDLMVKT